MTDPIPSTTSAGSEFGYGLVIFLLGLSIGGVGVAWWASGHPSIVTKVQRVPVNVPVAAPVAPQIAQAPISTVKVATCAVQAYKAPAEVRAHLLPKPIADNPKQAIVASARVEPDDHPETVTATVDTDTGQAIQSVVREPYKPFAWDFRRDLSADLVMHSGGPVARVEVRQDIAQVFGAHIHVGAYADAPLPVFGVVGRPDVGVLAGLHIALP